MISFYNSYQSVLGQFVLLVLTFMCLAGCAEKSTNEREGGDDEKKHVDTDQTPAEEKPADADQTSADYMLDPADYEKFRPGRSKSDILKDIQWKGDFIEAAVYQDHTACVISYGLFERAFRLGGESVLAIFVDGKFQKFVRYPEWDGRKRKIGDHRRLIRAVESEPVSIADLEKEMKENPPPSHTDWGLTAIWLVLGKGVLAAEARREKARAKVYQKNAEMRDQYNAARLKIGMTEKEVESVLKAKPIQTGEVEAGTFKIYGSTESLDIGVDSSLHYSNILVVSKKGKVSGIYGIYFGANGFDLAREMFVDLPSRNPPE